MSRYPPHDLATVIDHELVHVLLDQHCGRAAPYVSRWFHEGLAQELSGRPYVGMSEDDLVLTVRANRLLQFGSLRERFPRSRSELRRAYAQSFSFVAFLNRRFGLERLLEAARMSTPERGFRGGFYELTQVPMVDLEDQWREYIVHGSGAAYRFVLENCFSYVMILGVVLLAFAGMRRFQRDERAREKLERDEFAEQELTDSDNLP